MNTPAHLIFASAAFAKPGQAKVIVAALIGGFLPDASLYLMAGVSLFVLGIDPQEVFGQLYFSDAWQLVFSIDNSFILWGLAFGIALYLRSGWGIALTGGALLHLAFDFPLHHDDGRAHFWPLTDWKFESPLSYWDRDHYGHIIGPIEMLMCALCTVVLWRRFSGWGMRTLFGSLLALQFAPVFIWVFVFSRG